MFTLIKNETIKLLKRTKTLVTFIAFLLLTVLITFSTYKMIENNKKWQDPDYKIQMAQENINRYKADKTSSDVDKDYQNQIDELIKNEEANIEQYKLEKEQGKVDWKVTVNKTIEDSKNLLKDETLTKESKESIQQQLDLNEYYIANNIEPNDNVFNAYNALGTIIMILGSIFLAIGLAIFASDMVSGEYTPPTMKVLLIQPVSRGKVLFSKFISIALTCVTLIVSVEILTFLFVGVFFGFGSSNYPVVVGKKFYFDKIVSSNAAPQIKEILGSSHIAPIWKVTLQGVLLQILFIIAVVAFVFLISTVMKSSMLSMSLSNVTIVALFIIPNLSHSIKKVMPYCFITYGNSYALLDGSLNMGYNTPFITPLSASLVMSIWIVVCYLISHFVFVKKDVLI
ncbi:ABC transporter permease [Clostridium sediminicola]|uniref:ABC transporter permease subunit n=1 Tax=Clostridium sediminicola TaxID=3114879 RepID=UPI0031F27A19